MDPTTAIGLVSGKANQLQSWVQNAFNLWSTDRTTRKQQEWSERMYDRQRQDALADWHMQNLYNSPEETMKRLKAAGLNPNLVYGNGAVTQASPTRSSQVESVKREVPRLELSQGNPLLYADLDMRQAQTDNIKAQHDLIKAQVLETLARIPLLESNQRRSTQQTEEGWQRMSRYGRLTDLVISQAQATLKKTQADTQFTLGAHERAQAMAAPNLEAAIERVLQLRIGNQKARVEIENLKRTGKILEYENILNSMGVQKGDPLWQRWLADLINNIIP